jgi:hypothetical protein
MEMMSKVFRQRAICLGVLCLVMGFASSAFAIPQEQVLHGGPFAFTGQCCVSFNQTVAVTEPAKPMPLVLTFALDQVLSSSQGDMHFGLMVNGGTCKLYGSSSLPFILSADLSQPRTFQWVVFPNDGLRAGGNTFTLCGGGTSASGSLNMQSFTLTVRRAN